MALTGSCTTPYLFAVVSDPADARQTVRLRLSHSARDNHMARASRNYTFGARSHGYWLAAYASTLRLLSAGKARFRLLGLALPGGLRLAPFPPGREEWFLFRVHVISSIHRLGLSRAIFAFLCCDN